MVMVGIRFCALENYGRIKNDKMRLLEDSKQNARRFWREPKRFEEAYKINLRFYFPFIKGERVRT
jgi:hypothetical protein